MKQKLLELAKALGNAALTALLVWLSQFTTGCTAVVVPSDDSTAPTVTVTGALPVGVQFNSMTEKQKRKNKLGESGSGVFSEVNDSVVKNEIKNQNFRL